MESQKVEIDAKSKGFGKGPSWPRTFVQHQHIVAGDYSGLKGDFESFASTFEKCDFTRMRPRDIAFASGRELTTYTECRFDKSRFKKVMGGMARFERCSFLNIDLNGLLGHATEFVDCVFSGTIRSSTFHGTLFANYQKATPRTTNEFHGNDFSAAEFHDVCFVRGIDLSKQRLPVGDNYAYLADASAALAMLRQKYLQIPPSRQREAVFEFLQFAEYQSTDGQTQLFLCKDSQTRDREIVDAIWEDLRQINSKLLRTQP